MNSETSFALSVIAACAALFGTISIYNHKKTSVKIEAIKAGLVQEYRQGKVSPVWTTPNCDCK